MKLTSGQMASKLGINPYTLKRWYEFYNDLDEDEIVELEKSGMPRLPKYEIVGNRGDRIWNDEDLVILEKFKNWVPPTRNGVFKKHINGGE